MPKPIVSFSNVTKSYASEVGKKAKVALRDISLQVNKGEVLGIIGPNGAGKSTALKILMGFVSHNHGEVYLNGHLPTSPLCHKDLGYLPENPCLYKHLTIFDHLLFAAKIHNIPARHTKQRITELLKRVNLHESAKIPIRRFSKGMTQRAALAYAILHKPELLILDEPMSGLDPVGRQLVLDIIQEFKERGTTILFCSHILTDVERVCDRIAIMHEGLIAATTTPEKLELLKFTPKESLQSPLEAFFLRTIQPQTNNT